MLPHQRGNEAIISVRDLIVSYGDRKILKGTNLDIFPGETMVILGASGSGKSTLLRHIEGLAKPYFRIDIHQGSRHLFCFSQGTDEGAARAGGLFPERGHVQFHDGG